MNRILLSSALLVLASAASAQAPVSPGWSSFAGCWTPVATEQGVGSQVGTTSNPVVCIVPSSANGADLVTFVNGKQTERTVLEADGNHRDVSRQGCSGWEKSEFSADGRRLYLRSEQTCAGGIKRVTSGIFAIASNGDWINAVNVNADSANSVSVSRFAASSIPSSVPGEVSSMLAARELSDHTARTAARREVSVNAVVEATKFASAPAVEAWLAELQQDFELDDKTLVRLVDAGVAPSIIDVMVAVSNPRVFAVRPTGSGVIGEETEPGYARRGRYENCLSPVVDPWASYTYDPCDPYRRYSYYGGYRYRYGFDPYYGRGYYSPYSNYNNYGNPVVIIVSDDAKITRHGRMTKDGYKPGTSSPSGGSSAGASRSGSSSSGSDRTATRTPPSSQAPATASTSTTSTSSSSGEASSGRTATRKPPTA